jgi:hypothetical protein
MESQTSNPTSSRYLHRRGTPKINRSRRTQLIKSMREFVQRILGEQRIIESARPPAPPRERGTERARSYEMNLIIYYREQLEVAKKKEKKIQELLRTDGYL